MKFLSLSFITAMCRVYVKLSLKIYFVRTYRVVLVLIFKEKYSWKFLIVPQKEILDTET